MSGAMIQFDQFYIIRAQPFYDEQFFDLTTMFSLAKSSPFRRAFMRDVQNRFMTINSS